ncbi:MAG TPA: YdjY domain-containing protein [Gemmataceae bacterium]|nr:YdjY domain-containing protein [Gemmataceae bacterium]
MNTFHRFRRLMIPMLLGCLTGCLADEERSKPATPPETKKVKAGKNVTVEIQGDKRRVLIEAVVCLREGQLEMLMCRRQTKEHEAVLAADVDARDIHKALVLAGAEAGSPVQFSPKFKPASGTVIKVSVQYEEKGKVITVPGQKWVRNAKTKKDMDLDWVFAGSRFVPNEEDRSKPDYYLANEGDLLCLCNLESALLDLPAESPKALAERFYEANTDNIPDRDTKVTVILEPVIEKKKKDK